HLAEKQGMGLADVMLRQLSPEKTAPAAPVSNAATSANAERPDHSALLARRRLSVRAGRGEVTLGQTTAAADKSTRTTEPATPGDAGVSGPAGCMAPLVNPLPRRTSQPGPPSPPHRGPWLNLRATGYRCAPGTPPRPARRWPPSPTPRPASTARRSSPGRYCP